MFEKIKNAINPSQNPDLTQARDVQRQHLPTLWLLGKTGSGKSSLVHAITGESHIEIGNGFEPCTLTASSYTFPKQSPLLRFMDTRGLAESGYDASQDIEQALSASHGIVVLVKADDPEQSALLAALKQVKKRLGSTQLLLVHTAVLSSSKADRERQVAFNTQQITQLWGTNIHSIEVDFAPLDAHPEQQYSVSPNSTECYHYPQLIEQLAAQIPVIGLMANHSEHASLEQQNFKALENEVLWYAGSAATTDIFPAVGLVTVPAIQAKLLHSLANQYGVEWNKRAFSELIGCMGGSFAVQYAVKLGARQVPKFIPGWGQTVAAAAAAAISFGTTYAIGRSACYYFYKKSSGEEPNPEELQALYRDALKQGKKASGYEKDH